MTRFGEGELETAVQEMSGVALHSPPPPAAPSRSLPFDFRAQSKLSGLDGILDDARSTLPDGPPPSHPIPSYTVQNLDEAAFVPLWSRGIPIHVTNVHFRLPWTPQYFSEKYGGQECVLYDCQTEISTHSSVADFFKRFGTPQQRDNLGHPVESLKLKDWPPSSEFQKEFQPEFQDFIENVPMPDYVRPDGRLNMASMYPLNAIKPDLGVSFFLSSSNSRLTNLL